MKRQPTSRPALERPLAQRRRQQRRGMSIFYLILILTVVFAIASFALDYGRVQMSTTQLRTATDAAAKYAAQWVTAQDSVVLAKANDAAADNKVDGVVPIFHPSDVQVGAWNAQSRTFTANARPRNAVKISSAATIPLMLGTLVKQPTVTVHSTAIARAIPAGIVGLNGVTFHNNTVFASYDSSVTTNPSAGNSDSNVTVSSNGAISGQNNNTVKGDVYYGPAGSVSFNGTQTGASQQLANALVAPAEPAWTPAGNPGGAAANFTNNANNAVLPGGTYWFTSFTAQQPMSFSGPATLYVNGDVDLQAVVTPQDNRPMNLRIYQIGANRTFNADVTVTAQVVAPRSRLIGHNHLIFRGTCVFASIDVNNNGEFYLDESAPAAQSVTIVQ